MIKNVLVAGSGNTTGINVIRALKAANIAVMGCDYKMINPANKFCENKVVPPCKSINYIQAIIDIVTECKITHIIASNDHDVRVLMENNDDLKRLGVKLNGASIHTLDFLDKSLTTSLFIENGILTPEQVYSVYDYPYVLRKEKMGTNKKFVYIVRCKEDYEIINDTEFSSGILTRYIEGVEYTTDVLCNDDSDVLCAIPRKRVIVHDGMVFHSMIEENNEIISQVKVICKKLNVRGMSCIQCIKKEDSYYFIEINPRPGSGIDLSINSGMNMPALWVKNDFLDLPTPNWKLNMIRYYDAYFFE